MIFIGRLIVNVLHYTKTSYFYINHHFVGSCVLYEKTFILYSFLFELVIFIDKLEYIVVVFSLRIVYNNA